MAKKNLLRCSREKLKEQNMREVYYPELHSSVEI